MKTKLSLLLFAILVFGQLKAQKTHNLASSLVEVKGTATLYHHWSSKTTEASAQADMVLKDGKLEKINSLYFEIPAKSIKSNNKIDLMDQRTYEALKADQSSAIVFVLKEIKKLKQGKNKNTLLAEGELTIAGKTQKISLNLEAKVLEKNSLEVTGSHKLKMTDYGIIPPSFLSETLTVGDMVNISFSLNFTQN